MTKYRTLEATAVKHELGRKLQEAAEKGGNLGREMAPEEQTDLAATLGAMS